MRFILALLLTLACAPSFADAASDTVPRGPLPRSVLPERYDLELRLDPDAERFSGRVAIDVDVRNAVDTFWLHGRDLAIDSASLTTADGETFPLKIDVADAAGGVLRVQAPTPLATGKARIHIAWSTTYDDNLQGIYRVEAGGANYLVTQMQPLGARRAFPSFDEPAFKTTWEVSLVVPDTQQAFANARQRSVEPAETGWKRLHFEAMPSTPTYLLAFAVGPWDIVEWQDIPPNGVRKIPIKLRGIAPKGRGGEMRYALEHTAVQLAALERYFALPYPSGKLDLLAAPDFAFGAMENTGLIVYRESLLLGVDTAPTALRQAYWATHTHELAHQWFGNLVTMPWWDDLWLNESFASWMEARILRELKPEYRIDRDILEGALYAMRDDSLASARRMHEPVHDHTTVASAFDGITYAKGAAVLSMFERYLGEDRFRDAIRAHVRRHAGGSATSADLMRSIAGQGADASRLQAAFASFTDQAGVPLVRADLRCEDGRATLALTQERYRPLGSSAVADARWGIPLCVRYPSGDTLRSQCTLFDAARSELVLETSTCPAWVHPNADGAGYFRFALAADDRAALEKAFVQLNAAEQRVYADSLVAAFDSGLLSAADFLAFLPTLAASQDRAVVVAGSGTLAWMREHLAADADERDAFERLLVSIYQPRLDAVGLDESKGDDDERKLLRQELVELLAPLPAARTLRETLAWRGRAVLGLDGDGQLHLDAVASDQRGVALQLAAELGGEREFDAIVRHLDATDDAYLRRQLLYALGSAHAPVLVARARVIALGDTLRPGEVASIPLTQMEMPALREATRRWMRANFEVLFGKLPTAWAPHLPSFLAAGQCSVADADALQAGYAERMKDVEGGALSLTQAVEAMRLCAARLEHHRRVGFGGVLRR